MNSFGYKFANFLFPQLGCGNLMMFVAIFNNISISFTFIVEGHVIRGHVIHVKNSS